MPHPGNRDAETVRYFSRRMSAFKSLKSPVGLCLKLNDLCKTTTFLRDKEKKKELRILRHCTFLGRDKYS